MPFRSSRTRLENSLRRGRSESQRTLTPFLSFCHTSPELPSSHKVTGAKESLISVKISKGQINLGSNKDQRERWSCQSTTQSKGTSATGFPTSKLPWGELSCCSKAISAQLRGAPFPFSPWNGGHAVHRDRVVHGGCRTRSHGRLWQLYVPQGYWVK